MIAQCDARVHEHVHPPCLVFCADNRGVTVRGLTVYLLAGPPRAGGDPCRGRPRATLEATPAPPQCTAATRTRTGQGQGHRCSVQRHPGGKGHEKLAYFSLLFN